jgi:SNF2 family DNA or RNA helicase
MIVLHAHWLLPVTFEIPGHLVFWAETSSAVLKGAGGRPRAVPHPFALPRDELIRLGRQLGGGITGLPVPANVILPALKSLPFPSPKLVHDWQEFDGAVPTGLRRFFVIGLSYRPAEALQWLSRFPSPAELPGTLAVADDLAFWITTARFVLELLAAQRYVPGLDHVGGRLFFARWRASQDHPDDARRLAKLVQGMPPAARAGVPHGLPGTEAPPADRVVESFVNTLIDAAVREWYGPSWHRLQGDDVATCWLNALYSADRVVEGPVFSLAGLARAHTKWLRQLHAAGTATFRILLRLGVPEEQGDPWPLDVLLQARDDPSLMVPAAAVWESDSVVFTYLDRRFDNPQERLLEGLGYVSRVFPPMRAALRERNPTGARLAVEDAYRFLREAAPLLEQSGFGLLVPPWWNRRGATLAARLRLRTSDSPPSVSSGLLSMEKLVDYRWEVVLGDQSLSREEFEALVRLKAPLVQIRGQWVALNPEQIEAAIRFWHQQQAPGDMDLLEALRWRLEAEGEVDGLPVDEVVITGWLGEFLDRFEQGERIEIAAQPDRLQGDLRPYQQRGFSWLAFMRRWGLGACLADDMGLGKTIQAIALFLDSRATSRAVAPALVICPTSVAGNWQREIERFAPDLKVLVHHGGDRASGDEFLAQAEDHDVIITSYGLARRDGELLSGIRWQTLVLDEAQNIKNPAAKQTQAIRAIPADSRMALTGTPVENRLGELWSIMQFLNPGYLGSRERFRREFALPVERYGDQEAAGRLRQLVGPFILRRLKTDPNVIRDLPEKMEMKVYCTLTPEQATLYQAVVDDSLAQLESIEVEPTDVMQRRGLILSVLMQLKQICNHPAQFLADGSELPGRSGKMARLTEMLEEMLSVGDRALVFSQFSTMGEMLRIHLQQVFGREVLFLHGATPRKQRERMVDRFQARDGGPSIFVLSLKAGGVGLNLTAANHVFHFDRWWNPAVEQQATDRAFRIGQTRNVQVHKFITAGTLEENIDQLIESKRALAESVIGAGEAWLTELSTDQLRNLVALKR